MVSTRPVISKSTSPSTNPCITVQSEPITMDINVTFMFHSLLITYQGRGAYFSFRFLLILQCSQSGQQIQQFYKFSFLLIFIRSGHLAEIWWSVWISKSQRSLSVIFYRTEAKLCNYDLFVWSNHHHHHHHHHFYKILLLLLLLLLQLQLLHLLQQQLWKFISFIYFQTMKEYHCHRE